MSEQRLISYVSTYVARAGANLKLYAGYKLVSGQGCSRFVAAYDASHTWVEEDQLDALLSSFGFNIGKQRVSRRDFGRPIRLGEALFRVRDNNMDMNTMQRRIYVELLCLVDLIEANKNSLLPLPIRGEARTDYGGDELETDGTEDEDEDEDESRRSRRKKMRETEKQPRQQQIYRMISGKGEAEEGGKRRGGDGGGGERDSKQKFSQKMQHQKQQQQQHDREPNARPVECLSLPSHKVIATYANVRSAYRCSGVEQSTIFDVCNNRKKGNIFSWRFADEPVVLLELTASNLEETRRRAEHKDRGGRDKRGDASQSRKRSRSSKGVNSFEEEREGKAKYKLRNRESIARREAYNVSRLGGDGGGMGSRGRKEIEEEEEEDEEEEEEEVEEEEEEEEEDEVGEEDARDHHQKASPSTLSDSSVANMGSALRQLS